VCHGEQEYYMIVTREVHYRLMIYVSALFEQLQLLKEQYLIDMNELYGMLCTSCKQVCTYHLDKVFAVCILLCNVQSVAHCVVACIVPVIVLISAS